MPPRRSARAAAKDGTGGQDAAAAAADAADPGAIGAAADAAAAGGLEGRSDGRGGGNADDGSTSPAAPAAPAPAAANDGAAPDDDDDDARDLAISTLNDAKMATTAEAKVNERERACFFFSLSIEKSDLDPLVHALSFRTPAHPHINRPTSSPGSRRPPAAAPLASSRS